MVGYIRIILEEKGVHVSIWICLFYLDIRDCVISCHVFSSNSHFAWTMIVIRQNINWLLLLLLTPIGKLRSRWRNGYRGSLENHPITKRRRRWLNISKRVTISFNHGRPSFFFFFFFHSYLRYRNFVYSSRWSRSLMTLSILETPRFPEMGRANSFNRNICSVRRSISLKYIRLFIRFE